MHPIMHELVNREAPPTTVLAQALANAEYAMMGLAIGAILVLLNLDAVLLATGAAVIVIASRLTQRKLNSTGSHGSPTQDRPRQD